MNPNRQPDSQWNYQCPAELVPVPFLLQKCLMLEADKNFTNRGFRNFSDIKVLFTCNSEKRVQPRYYKKNRVNVLKNVLITLGYTKNYWVFHLCSYMTQNKVECFSYVTGNSPNHEKITKLNLSYRKLEYYNRHGNLHTKEF